MKFVDGFLGRASSAPRLWILACVGLVLFVTADPALGQSVQTFPGEGLHAMLAFEDSWPQQSDMDANDVVIRFQVQLIFTDTTAAEISGVRCVMRVEALGTAQSNGLALRLHIPRSSLLAARIRRNDGLATPIQPLQEGPQDGTEDLAFVLYEDLRGAFPPGSGDFLNTQPGGPIHLGESLELDIEFIQPFSSASAIALAPYDIFIFRSGNYAHQIHLPEFGPTASGLADLFGSEDDCSNQVCVSPDGNAVDNLGRYYVTRQGLPWAVAFPRASAWSKEGVPIDQAYPHLPAYIHSLGTTATDWWQQGNPNHLFDPLVAAPSLSPWAIWALMGALAGLGPWVSGSGGANRIGRGKLSGVLRTASEDRSEPKQRAR